MKQAFDNKEVTVATVCGGSLLLAVVEYGPRFVSGGGVTSGLDVAFYVVERD
ncbi:hypothetical protein ACFQI7_30365 [Paenibacillus allorhizosphaerae]|uniref:DJ-1/PfpI domain-containing protein n=1 Tax=Paenibacillus allorhizosphaerae TaxID=2849866 RepID=A0ABM8VH47_9BACL|nr:hypothetical protein [Paenibacillus allorhizosphaerae]CAG7640508.1 hypothetical protein PAECIP111802_02655 [Paenibacillus allorhizosphaerae]